MNKKEKSHEKIRENEYNKFEDIDVPLSSIPNSMLKEGMERICFGVYIDRSQPLVSLYITEDAKGEFEVKFKEEGFKTTTARLAVDGFNIKIKSCDGILTQDGYIFKVEMEKA